MTKRFTRRQTLVALGSMAIAACGMTAGVRRAPAQVRVKPWRQIAMEVLPGSVTSRQALIAGLSESPSDLPPDASETARNIAQTAGVLWTEEGCAYEHARQLDAAIEAIRKQISDDLGAGRVLVAGGWVISKTEAAVLARCAARGERLTTRMP